MGVTTMISMKKFKDEVEEFLTGSDLESLKTLIRSFSDEVKPDERETFLSKLLASPTKEFVVNDDILDEIEGLKELVESRFDEEPDWDDYDYDVEEPGPDADLVENISEMFDSVNAIFDYGHPQLAQKAYEKLFQLLEMEDDYGRSINSHDLENIDLRETRARYLRSLYMTLSGKERVIMLMKQMKAWRSFASGDPPSLREIIEISTDTLPGWDVFLSQWIKELQAEKGRCINAWHREAVFLKEGVVGLKELARASGKENPRIFYEIVHYYRDQDPSIALDEAKNALSVLPEGLSIRAAIADQMRELSKVLNDTESFHQAEWISFKEKPSIEKLLSLFEENRAGEREALMKEAVHVLEKYRLKETQRTDIRGYREERWECDDIEAFYRPNTALLLHGYFFAGMTNSAFSLVSKEDELGWTRGVPPIFISVCFFHAIPENCLGETSVNFRRFWGHYLASSRDSHDDKENSALVNRLNRVYEELKASNVAKFDQATIDWCYEISKKRVGSIVSNQFRGAYGRAALLTAVCHDVLEASGYFREAKDFYLSIKNEFPRHSAFQKELSYVMGTRG